MSTKQLTPLDKKIRRYVYDHFVKQACPPTVAETAAAFNLSLAETRASYHSLNQKHALFLDPDTDHIRMANPFSAIPTGFRVHGYDQSWWANCAWDALAIPAMLQIDATIEAVCADCQKPLPLNIQSGRVKSDDAVVHFTVPFSHWYDDLIFT